VEKQNLLKKKFEVPVTSQEYFEAPVTSQEFFEAPVMSQEFRGLCDITRCFGHQ